MEEFVILTDSAADLDSSLRTACGIEVLPAHITVRGREQEAFLSWDTISREDFYAALKAAPDQYKTSPPSVSEMAEKMETYVSKGQGVLYLTISGGLSGTYGFVCAARELLKEKYPSARVIPVDSRRFGPAIGLMAMNAAHLREEGKTLEETAQILEETKNRYHQAGWLDDLSYVARTGRLTHAKAFFGTLAGVKPIGEFDQNGLTTVLGKVKGEKKAYEVLLGYIRATATEPEKQTFVIAQTNRLAQAEKYKELIENAFHPKAVLIKDVYPMCGINIGPGLMAAYYVGEEISDGLEKEGRIIKELIGG